MSEMTCVSVRGLVARVALPPPDFHRRGWPAFLALICGQSTTLSRCVCRRPGLVARGWPFQSSASRMCANRPLSESVCDLFVSLSLRAPGRHRIFLRILVRIRAPILTSLLAKHTARSTGTDERFESLRRCV